MPFFLVFSILFWDTLNSSLFCIKFWKNLIWKKDFYFLHTFLQIINLMPLVGNRSFLAIYSSNIDWWRKETVIKTKTRWWEAISKAVNPWKKVFSFFKQIKDGRRLLGRFLLEIFSMGSKSMTKIYGMVDWYYVILKLILEILYQIWFYVHNWN